MRRKQFYTIRIVIVLGGEPDPRSQSPVPNWVNSSHAYITGTCL